jgi:hypothetical protein
MIVNHLFSKCEAAHSAPLLPEPDRPRLVSWPKAQLQIHLQINLFSPDPLFWKVITVSGIAQPTLEGNERVLPCGSDRRWLGSPGVGTESGHSSALHPEPPSRNRAIDWKTQ